VDQTTGRPRDPVSSVVAHQSRPPEVTVRRFLSYPSIVSTLALLVALSGTAYAAATIRGGDVVNGSLTGKDLKNESVRS
jgi:hypothetical protein